METALQKRQRRQKSKAHKKTANTYIWSGTDKKGVIKKGELVSVNEQLVRAYLQKQGIAPKKIYVKAKPLWESKGTVKSKHIVGFSRQMATMLKAGMSVTKSLALIAEGVEKPLKLKEIIEDLHSEVEDGLSFSKALSKYPVYFNDLYISLVTAGEEAGLLEETMNKIAVNVEKAEAVKKKVKKAMTYPAIVVFVAIVVTAILLVWVIPVFKEFFDNAKVELPAITKLVSAASEALINWGWMIVVGLAIGIYFFFWYKKRNRKFQRAVNKFSFKIPVLGGILKLGAVARFSRTIGVLFDAGVPLMKSLRATAPATGSVIYEDATNQIANDVENGSQLNFAMQQTGKFDAFSVQMTSIGEESGALGDMLGKVADYYDEELDYKIDNLTTILEPMIISFIAVIVGTILIAMYLPIFMMGNVVG